jgi:hypothetical protein
VIRIKVEVTVQVDKQGLHGYALAGLGVGTGDQSPNFFHANAVHRRELIEPISHVGKRAGLVNQDSFDPGPRAETGDGDLEGSDLLSLGLIRVEGVRGQVGNGVDGRIGTGAPRGLQRGPAN